MWVIEEATQPCRQRRKAQPGPLPPACYPQVGQEPRGAAENPAHIWGKPHASPPAAQGP